MTSREYPRIVVAPPGPKGKAIIDRDAAWTSPSYIKEYPLVIAGGQGAMIEDVDGNRYIDYMAGIAVSSTGYNHPKVVEAIKAQGLTFVERPFTVEEAYGAREAFITSASLIVMPVVRIDGRPVGNGAPGLLASALRREFHRHAEWA